MTTKGDDQIWFASTFARRHPRYWCGSAMKPVIRQLWDDLLQCYMWRVVWPRVNNHGNYFGIDAEVKLCENAEILCRILNKDARRVV